MKALIFISMTLFTLPLFACVDLSGTYATSEGLIYTVIQNECSDMIVSDTTTKTITFDNVEQLIYEYEVEDNGELQHMQVFIKSMLKDEKWIYNERVIKISKDGPQKIDQSWSEVFLDLDKNIVTHSHRSNGSIEKYIDKKIAPLN
jgi:hypothetical protein